MSDDYTGVGLQIEKCIKHYTVKFIRIFLPEKLKV